MLVLIPGGGVPIQRQWMLLPVTGVETSTEYAPTLLDPSCNLAKTHAKGTLIFPCWPSVPYWPMIYPDGLVTVDSIRAIKVFQALFCPVLPGRSDNSLQSCDMLAVYFDFTQE